VRTAVVTLAFLADEVTLDVYDDGTGFGPEASGSGVAGRADGSGFGLRAMLTEFEDFSVAAEAADGDAALRELTRLRTLGERVDVVLMDLQMGAGMDGVTATAAIRQLGSRRRS
jgi:CheY-like chemotaxis protein